MTENRDLTEVERTAEIFRLLREHYPRARTALKFDTPFQLLVAVILSAQTTDEQVNRITPALFARASSPAEMAQLKPAELERLIKGCGLYRNKSRFLVEASRRIVQQFNGRVPDNFVDLVSLPGVGRKTANVILYNAFGRPALAVDTHVYRVSRRLGLARGKRVEEVERELTARLPEREWGPVHHRLIAHGRSLCHARRPECSACFLNRYCPSKIEGE